MAWAPIAAAAIPVVAGALGGNKASKADKAAQRMLDEAREAYGNLQVPDLASQQYDAEQTAYAGDIDPALLAQIGDISTAYDQISTDPRFTQAQYDSLGSLDSLINGGGMTDLDKLNFQKAQDEAAQTSARQQAGITRDLAERGMAGGGAEIAQRMMAAQGAANNSSAAAQEMAANAQQRALQAIMSRGSLAGDMQSQDFNQQATVANARDAIAKWNQEQALGVNKANQAATNAALESNRNAQQNVYNTNANANNAAAQYNAGAVGTQYNQQLDKINGMSGAAKTSAATRAASADQTRNQYAGYGQAAAGAVTALGDMYKNQPVTTTSSEKLAGEDDQRKLNTYA